MKKIKLKESTEFVLVIGLFYLFLIVSVLAIEFRYEQLEQQKNTDMQETAISTQKSTN